MKERVIEERFLWRDSDIYNSEEEFYADCDRIRLMLKKLAGFKGKLDTPANILAYLKLEEEMERKLEKVNVFAYMNKSANGSSARSVKLLSTAQEVITLAGTSTAFANDEIGKLANDQLRAMAHDPEFSSFKRSLEFLIKNKPHERNEEANKILAGVGAFTDFDSIHQTLSDIEMPIADIVLKNGKHLPLANNTYSKYLHSPDRYIRRQAYTKLLEAYKRFNLTYSSNYLNAVKEAKFITNSYNFKTTFERSCFYDEADVKIVNVILESVHENLPLLQKMQKLRAKALKVEDFSLYDIFAPLTTDKPPKYYYNHAVNVIKESLKPEGKDYVNLIDHALNDRWVDLYPRNNKDSSCYCISCYDVHPFILTNFNNTFEGVTTLSHELGHAIQGYMAGIVQPYSTSECSRLTCEIASTVNEILTRKYVIDTTKNIDEKITAIDSLLGDFYGAIYKQTLYTEFELFVFEKTEAGETLTFEDLNNKYYELLKTYFGESVVLPNNAGIEWSRIPHFYSPFYVYKYVVGFASAIIICGNLLSGDINYQKKYLDFLAAGSSKTPKELLKMVDIDLTDKETYTRALKLYELYIDELSALIEDRK